MTIGLCSALGVSNDVTVKQVDRAARIIGVCRRMRHHDDSRALGVQRAQHLHDFLAVGGIEVTGRLVGQDQRLVADNGARDCDALLLAA